MAIEQPIATSNACRRLMCRLVVSLLAAATFSLAATPMAAFAGHAPHRDIVEVVDGYVPVSDGTQLRMQVEYPKERPAGGVSTLLFYQGYSHKLGSPDGDPFRDWAAHNGYAVMVVSVRGAGCSGGSYDFLSHQEALDGRDVIAWIIGQPWSDRKVAMVGDSYTGFEQLPVAALQPEGLVAIAPGQPIGDLYRDVAHPGGISNTLLPTLFSADVLVDVLPEAPHESLGGIGLPDNPNRPQCIINQTGAPVGLTGTAAGLFAAHRWDDQTMRSRAPAAHIADIKVPTFTVVAWQDQTVGSRAIVDLPRVGGRFHAVLSNGGHGWPSGIWYADRLQKRLREFLDFYVRGIDKGFGASPPIEVWWESQRGPDPDGDGFRAGDVLPRWTSGFSRMPPPQATAPTFFLSAEGRLTESAGTGGPDEYAYVGGTGQYRGDALVGPFDPTTGKAIDWSPPPDSDKSLVYTSSPLAKDLTVLGSGSLDLWLESTATDTDVQVVLTEVRPDGQEVYVQAGWLRASHRKLDAQRSTATLPFHTHQELDTQPLTPLTAAKMRVEIRPFGHVFRAGSRLRVFIEAPPRTSGLWSFESLPGAAVNRVYHDALRPSALTLATLPGHAAPVGHAECGTIIRQPCRPDARTRP